MTGRSRMRPLGLAFRETTTMAKDIDEAQPQIHSNWRVIQEFDDLKDLPLALPDNARKKSVVALNQILADTMTLRDLYKKSHWQISGATFYSLHLLLDKHYEEQAEAVDKIAERIMSARRHQLRHAVGRGRSHQPATPPQGARGRALHSPAPAGGASQVLWPTCARRPRRRRTTATTAPTT